MFKNVLFAILSLLVGSSLAAEETVSFEQAYQVVREAAYTKWKFDPAKNRAIVLTVDRKLYGARYLPPESDQEHQWGGIQIINADLNPGAKRTHNDVYYFDYVDQNGYLDGLSEETYAIKPETGIGSKSPSTISDQAESKRIVMILHQNMGKGVK